MKYISQAGISLVLMAALTPSVQAASISIDASEYGDKWPFTVDSVTLSCRNYAAVLMTSSTGTTYWLNGKAGSQFKDLPSWREVAKPEPQYGAGAVMSLPPDLIKRGLTLCPR